MMFALANTSSASAGKRSGPTPPLTASGLPNVIAEAAVVIDVDTGDEYFAKDSANVRAIASTGKIFVALVVRKHGIDLDARTTINKVDRDYARGGARTRLPVQHTLTNRDLLRAMLVVSDNRAPTALGRAVGLNPDQLVAEMNGVAKALGLGNTKFTDPTGMRGNVSTAREMAKAYIRAMSDPILAGILGTREIHVRTYHSKPRRIYYRNSTLVMHSDRTHVTGGKTGFTSKAGYCLLVSAKLADRHVALAFLGAPHKNTRFRDFWRVTKWFLTHSAPPSAQ